MKSLKYLVNKIKKRLCCTITKLQIVKDSSMFFVKTLKQVIFLLAKKEAFQSTFTV